MTVTVFGESPFAEALRIHLHEQGHAIEVSRWPDVVWFAQTMSETSIELVLAQIAQWHRLVGMDVPFLVSCEWPVGTMAQAQSVCPGRVLTYVMENVRAAHALKDIRTQAFLAVGCERFGVLVHHLLSDIARTLIVMRPVSAELVKPALNALLALQIAFVNELAEIAGAVGAEAEWVAQALRADPRVSDTAPLVPGQPFASPCFQRDLSALQTLVDRHGINAPILSNILLSNVVRS